MPQVVLVIKGTAQKGKRDEIRKAFETVLAPRAQKNKAQELVVWAEHQGDPDVFFLIEVYRDAAAVEESAQSAWFAEYMAATGPLLAGQPEFAMATPAWAKGV